MRQVLLTTLLMSLFSMSHAANWAEISRADDELMEIDLETLQNIGTPTAPIVKAWIKLTSLNDDYGDKLASGEFAIGLQQYDCAKRTELFLAYTSYDKQGRVKESKKNDKVVYQDIRPDSVGELLFKTACSSFKPSKKTSQLKTL